MDYGAVPMGQAIDIACACYAPAYGRMIGPLGPARVTTTGIERPSQFSDAAWRQMRATAGIVLRAILFRRESQSPCGC